MKKNTASRMSQLALLERSRLRVSANPRSFGPAGAKDGAHLEQDIVVPLNDSSYSIPANDSKWYPLDGGKHMHALFSQARAMNVADEHGRTGLTLEIANPPAHGIDGKPKPLRRRTEASAARDFEKYARRIPVRQTAECDATAFLLRNAPFHCQMHTSPFRLLNLAESCTDYNHGGLAILRFHGDA